MYLSETPLACCCCPRGKKSASSNKMEERLGKPRIASKWYDGIALVVMYCYVLSFICVYMYVGNLNPFASLSRFAFLFDTLEGHYV